MALSMLTGISLLVFSVTVAAYREMPDPFSPFSDLFGDDARQAVLSRGFTCRTIESDTLPRTIADNCSQHDTDKLFSGISLQMSDNTANEISFWLRENTFTLGDLVLLWGQPEVRLYCEMAVASRPTRHIIGLAGTHQSGLATYFSPIIYVFFGRSGTPDWSHVLMFHEGRRYCGSHGIEDIFSFGSYS